jgi:hypothetical protein
VKTVLTSIMNKRGSVPAPTTNKRGSVLAPTNSVSSHERSELLREDMEIYSADERTTQGTAIPHGSTNERGSGRGPTLSGNIPPRERSDISQEDMNIDPRGISENPQEEKSIESRGRHNQRAASQHRRTNDGGSRQTPTQSGNITLRERSDIGQDDMNNDSRGRPKQRAAKPHRASKSSSSSTSRSSSENRKHLKNAPFVEGIVPSGRPAIKDYIPIVKRRLLDGAYIYENWVLSNNAFPDKELQYGWAREAWERASVDAIDLYKLSDRMMKLVSCFFFFFFILALANLIRSQLEDLVFAGISRTLSDRSSQPITVLAQVRTKRRLCLTSSAISISWKTKNFTTRYLPL